MWTAEEKVLVPMIFRLLWFAFVVVPCGAWWIGRALAVYRRLRATEVEVVIIDRGDSTEEVIDPREEGVT